MELSIILIILCMYGTSVSIMPELKHNILRFGYGVNLDMKACYYTHLIDFMW